MGFFIDQRPQKKKIDKLVDIVTETLKVEAQKEKNTSTQNSTPA